MISAEKTRELIPDNEKYSDEEIEKIRTTLYGLADLAFDCWLEERKNGLLKKTELQDTTKGGSLTTNATKEL